MGQFISTFLFSAEGWYIGGTQESCDTACKGHGLVCSKQGYKNHHSDVNSSNNLRDVIERLGGKLPSKSCNKDNYPYVPSFHSGVCQFATKPDLYDCTLRPESKKGHKKQRLCYCQPLEGMLIFLSKCTTLICQTSEN